MPEIEGALVRIYEITKLAERADAAAFADNADFTLEDYQTLHALMVQPYPSQEATRAQLADATRVTRAAMTSRLDRLVEAGLVTREIDPSCARSSGRSSKQSYLCASRGWSVLAFLASAAGLSGDSPIGREKRRMRPISASGAFREPRTQNFGASGASSRPSRSAVMSACARLAAPSFSYSLEMWVLAVDSDTKSCLAMPATLMPSASSRST